MWVLLLSNISFAYSSQTQKFVTLFEDHMKSMDTDKKLQYFDLLASILDTPKVKNNTKSEVKTLVSEMKDRITTSKSKLTNTTTNQTTNITTEQEKLSDWTSYQTLQNVDFDKIREARLSRHNNLRAEKWVSNLSYHSDLEKSANTRASYLASNSITNWTHTRTSSDWYYNYNSIKERFWNLWISFAKETGGKTAFSESVGYRGYKCSWWDCTQTLIDVTKKIFDWYLKEWENGAHYKAIIMPHFNYIWIGFQVDPSTNYVYVVIHYAEKLINS